MHSFLRLSLCLRLCLGPALLLGVTALPAQNAPSRPEKASSPRVTHEQGLAAVGAVGTYSGSMMINAYIGLVYAERGLQEGRDLEDVLMLVTYEESMLKRIEEQSTRLRAAFSTDKEFSAGMDMILRGVTLLKAQAHALMVLISSSASSEADLPAKRQASRAFILKNLGMPDDPKIIP